MNERVCLRIMKKGYYAAAKGAKEISYKPPWKVLIHSYCQGKLASWQKYIVWVYFQKSKTNLYISAAGTENLFSPKIFTPHFYHIVLYFVVVQSLSRVRLFATPWTAAHQVSLSFTISRVCSNSNPLSRWWCPIISSSVIPFSSCPQSYPAWVSFPMSWLFASGDQSVGASASVLPMNIQGWFPLGLTDLISLLSKGLSGVCILDA